MVALLHSLLPFFRNVQSHDFNQSMFSRPPKIQWSLGNGRFDTNSERIATQTAWQTTRVPTNLTLQPSKRAKRKRSNATANTGKSSKNGTTIEQLTILHHPINEVSH